MCHWKCFTNIYIHNYTYIWSTDVMTLGEMVVFSHQATYGTIRKLYDTISPLMRRLYLLCINPYSKVGWVHIGPTFYLSTQVRYAPGTLRCVQVAAVTWFTYLVQYRSPSNGWKDDIPYYAARFGGGPRWQPLTARLYLWSHRPLFSWKQFQSAKVSRNKGTGKLSLVNILSSDV